MLNKINVLLTEVDFFSYNPTFFSKNNYNYKTPLGGILVIITLVINLTGILYFCKDIYNKMNPKIYETTIVKSTFPDHFLTSNDFKISVSMNSYSKGFKIIRDNKIYKMIYTQAEIKNGKRVSEYELLTRQCTKDDFIAGNMYEILGESYPYDQFECLDDSQKITIGGTFDSGTMKYIKVYYYTCREYYKDNPNIDNLCATNEEIDDFFVSGNSSITVFYNRLFTPDDFLNPIKEIVKRDLTVVNKNTYVMSTILLQTINLVDDIGVIFENKVQKTYFGVEDFQNRSMSLKLRSFK